MELAYDALVDAVREGRASDEDIKRTVLPKDFAFLHRFLQRTISTVDEIDLSAQRRIAEASGFAGHLKERIHRSRGWKKALAVRVLASLRDPRNIPLLRDLFAREEFTETAYAAALGLALCKDGESAPTCAWSMPTPCSTRTA